MVPMHKHFLALDGNSVLGVAELRDPRDILSGLQFKNN